MGADELTAQESRWAGEFGTAYVLRNRGTDLVAANKELFRKVLARTGPVTSVLELGCNTGNNLRALRGLLPDAALHGVEINAEVTRLGRCHGRGGFADRPCRRSDP